MRKILIILSVFLAIFASLVFPNKSLAQGVHGNCGDTSIDTAIGCIPVLSDNTGTAFANFILKWAVGVGSGVAFILILYSSFMIMTSQGNAERLKAGQELLTSAISGIILIIMSVFVLNLIGVDILGIFT